MKRTLPDLRHSLAFSSVILLTMVFHAALFSRANAEPATVRGVITCNTLWEKAKSPYLVTGDVTVPEGMTLRIEPGVEVRFMASGDEERSGADTNRTELIIHGELLAVGTAADSIIFTSGAVQPSYGDWYGVGVMTSSKKITMKFVRCEYHQCAFYAPLSYSGIVSTDTMRIENSHFREGGAVLQSDAGYHAIILDDNLIEGTVMFGYFGGSSIVVSNNRITTGRTSGGISVDGGASVKVIGNVIRGGGGIDLRSEAQTVERNILDSCWGNGINIRIIGSLSVLNNTVRFSTGRGISIRSIDPTGAPILIRGNIVSLNGLGVFMDGAGGTIDSNTIIRNTGKGVQLISRGGSLLDTLRYNTIAENGSYGIDNRGASRPVINYNNLYGNAVYDYYTASSATMAPTLDAKFNWWGDATTAEIMSGGNPKNITRIFDGHDSTGVSFISYTGWLNGENGTPMLTGKTGMVVWGDPDGVKTYGFKRWDTAVVTVNDADRNVSLSDPDTVRVHVRSITDQFGETLVLTETGPATGIFRGTIPFQEADAEVHADAKLQVRTGERLVAVYVDPDADYGNLLQVGDTAYYGVSLESGVIRQNSFWERSRSPYLITGDVTVDTGTTLTIEPGVTIRFLQGHDVLSSGVNAAQSEFIVNGELRAEGTVGDSIIFTSAADVPGSGDWYGIRVSKPSSKLSMKYVRCEYSLFGVDVSEYANPTDSITIEHCRLRNGRMALQAMYTSSRPLSFNNNIVDGSAMYGGSFQGTVILNNNIINGHSSTLGLSITTAESGEIRNNQIFGAAFGISASDGSYIITGNTADGCQEAGIDAWGNHSLVITDNIVRNLKGVGRDVYAFMACNNGTGDVSILFRRNTATSNLSHGVLLQDVSGRADSNDITMNGGCGIVVQTLYTRSSSDTLAFNTISGNGSNGIQCTGFVHLTANDNNIMGNGKYDYCTTVPSSFAPEHDARRNWWGDATTAEMMNGANPKNITRIFDGRDSSSIGLVNYVDWRKEAIVGAGPTGIVWRAAPGLPDHFYLEQNYPNPFNPSTKISFDIPQRSFVVMTVYDAFGREVSTLVSEELPAGRYIRTWNASGFASGVYFCRLRSGSFSMAKKLLLLK